MMGVFLTMSIGFVACAIVAIFLVLLWYREKGLLHHIVRFTKFEIVYNVLGMNGLLEDVVMRDKNKTDLHDCSGKVAVITGGSRGIGAEVIRMLMRCNIYVINGCRDLTSAQKLLEKVRSEGITSGEMLAISLDTSSVKSVESFANTIKADHPEIHILINNAGKMFGPLTESIDGFESQYATNYLGHFYLTHLLFPLLREGGSDEFRARIVNVSSCAHTVGNINFEDINYRKSYYIPSEAYAQSKLAQILFSNHLDKMIARQKLPINTYCVHPGIVDTDLFNGTYLKKIAPHVIRLFFKTPEEGARSVICAAISHKFADKSGRYITNCQDRPASSLTYCERLQQRLFNITMEQLHVECFGRT